MASNRSRGAGNSAPAPAPVAVAQTQVEKVELAQTSLPPAPVVETATQEEAQAMIDSGEAQIPAAALVEQTTKAVDKKSPKGKAVKSLKVKAIAEGFYGNIRRYPGRPGEVFTLQFERHFSENWMEWVE